VNRTGDAALMAGENVPSRIVQRVFSRPSNLIGGPPPKNNPGKKPRERPRTSETVRRQVT